MTITLDLPDEMLAFLVTYGPTPERAAVAIIAIHLYREGKLSTDQLSRVLDFSTRLQVHAFLKGHGVPLQYGMVDLDHDRKEGDSILLAREDRSC